MKCCQLRGDGEPRHQGGDRAGRAGEGHEATPGGRGVALFNIIIIVLLLSLLISAGVCVRVPVPRGPRAGRAVRGGGAGGGGAGGADLRGAAGQGGDPRLPVHLPLQVGQ